MWKGGKNPGEQGSDRSVFEAKAVMSRMRKGKSRAKGSCEAGRKATSQRVGVSMGLWDRGGGDMDLGSWGAG